MDYDSDLDMSWLTQAPSLENSQASFNVGYSFVEEDIDLSQGVVSLEEGTSKQQVPARKVLYDNVLVKDISSDENLDKM